MPATLPTPFPVPPAVCRSKQVNFGMSVLVWPRHNTTAAFECWPLSSNTIAQAEAIYPANFSQQDYGGSQSQDPLSNLEALHHFTETIVLCKSPHKSGQISSTISLQWSDAKKKKKPSLVWPDSQPWRLEWVRCKLRCCSEISRRRTTQQWS